MERKDTESEKLREEVKRKRTALGYRLTRQLKIAEAREFLASGRVPADALGRGTFAAAKRLDSLPPGSSCMVCGADLGGKAGWIVEVAAPEGRLFKTICDADYATVNADAKTEVEIEVESDTESVPVPVQAAQAPAGDPVAAALKTLTAALSAPKPPPAPPVDEKKLIDEARKAAKDEAEKTAEGVMQKSVVDFLRGVGGGGGGTGSGGGGGESPVLAAAKGDGVGAAAKATSWSAKATPAAKNAVEVMTKFLSEFSYFRTGVSMRLVNTFAIADDKKAALASYCEVSQMEDLPDLIEKMKSPEFKAVCDAFAPFANVKPLNKRFAVFYGAPGGGKTHAAKLVGEKTNGDGKVDVVPCSPSMDAADTLYAYRLDYQTGKRGYIPTALLTAMVSGRAVVLDEVNLLPMEARMFLQNVLDNKDRVHVMGQEIPIRDGFFVIGTMNLSTGLGDQPLPLPLVDRACVVREFRTTTAQAAVGAGLC